MNMPPLFTYIELFFCVNIYGSQGETKLGIGFFTNKGYMQYFIHVLALIFLPQQREIIVWF